MAIGRAPQKVLALHFFAGNGAAAGMDFDGIVAGLERQGQRKIAKKWESIESRGQL
jgi:hypothetical protein